MIDNVRATLWAVIDNPAEDTPRLMYADALDERGDDGDAARAEYVRLAIGLKDVEPCTKQVYTGLFCSSGCATCDTKVRMAALFHGEPGHVSWLPFGIAKCVAAHRCNWHRGFVSTLDQTGCPWSTIVDMVALHPITAVYMSGYIPRTNANGAHWLITDRPSQRGGGTYSIPMRYERYLDPAARAGTRYVEYPHPTRYTIYEYTSVRAAHNDLDAARLKCARAEALELRKGLTDATD